MIIAIISIFMLFSSPEAKNEKHSETYIQASFSSDTITTNEGIESHKNEFAYIKGRFQKFTPWTEGKGANHMFWDWEIALPGGGSYPVITKSTVIELSSYEGKDVLVYGKVFFGIIIGDSNPNHQSATGYRIDIERIHAIDPSLIPQSSDTCRLWKEIEKHWNMNAYVEGKVIEYIPPHDSSKLGDEKIWQWELHTADNYSIPLTAKNTNLDINSYIGKNVIIKGFILNGIIFGRENTANIVGTRIDAEEIYLAEPKEPRSKIMLDLDDFNDEGLQKSPDGGLYSVHYEFCIPATEEALNEVKNINPLVGVYKTSKGRSGCSDKEWLCISSSRQKDFKKIILQLAGLSYIRRITQTFWE
jgi:hypothetical protein